MSHRQGQRCPSSWRPPQRSVVGVWVGGPGGLRSPRHFSERRAWGTRRHLDPSAPAADFSRFRAHFVHAGSSDEPARATQLKSSFFALPGARAAVDQSKIAPANQRPRPGSEPHIPSRLTSSMKPAMAVSTSSHFPTALITLRFCTVHYAGITRMLPHNLKQGEMRANTTWL